MVARKELGCSPHSASWRARGAEAIFCLSSWHQLLLNAGRDTAQWYGSSRLTSIITSKKAKLHTPEPTPPPPTVVEPGGRNGNTSSSTVWLVVSGYKEAAPGTCKPRALSPSTSHHGGSTLRSRHLRHREDAHLLGEYGAFSTTEVTPPH